MAPDMNQKTVFEPSSLFRLSYGLFVLSARQDGRDNGCIVNTVMQVTASPCRICVAVNKDNLTHDMILATGDLNVSVISTEADFALHSVPETAFTGFTACEEEFLQLFRELV